MGVDGKLAGSHHLQPFLEEGFSLIGKLAIAVIVLPGVFFGLGLGVGYLIWG